ncbi:hypothetical protein K438DRAFT_1765378 [Mycena galopus ATCC 62051]|nr:hypothetical protein K438DRAFT_1765378 [Mycena galopus ATCC 62051]
MYIDDSAEVDHDAEMRETENSDEDDDSYEAQVRRLDEQDFPMAEILGGHQDRLRTDAPYRIPAHMLEPTPSGSRAPTPAYIPRPPQTTACSPMPEFRPPIPHEAFLPPPQLQGSRAPTPQHTEPAFSREQTLLFLPESRGPTRIPPRFLVGQLRCIGMKLRFSCPTRAVPPRILTISVDPLLRSFKSCKSLVS